MAPFLGVHGVVYACSMHQHDETGYCVGMST